MYTYNMILGENSKLEAGISYLQSELNFQMSEDGFPVTFCKEGENTKVQVKKNKESACITLKVNNPELPIVCGDITDISVKQNICNIALQNNVDIICGGPPCQGFSLAGLRDKNDSRNQLFRDFVDIVKIVTPKVIVFENVVGLLSYNKGITYNEILELFSGLGYNTCARVLNAADYGVPQKRKRVIILCVRKDIDVMVSDLYPTPLLSELNYVDVKNSLFDLSCIPCSIESFYKSDFSSDYIKLMKEEEYDKVLSLFINSGASEENSFSLCKYAAIAGLSDKT